MSHCRNSQDILAHKNDSFCVSQSQNESRNSSDPKNIWPACSDHLKNPRAILLFPVTQSHWHTPSCVTGIWIYPNCMCSPGFLILAGISFFMVLTETSGSLMSFDRTKKGRELWHLWQKTGCSTKILMNEHPDGARNKNILFFKREAAELCPPGAVPDCEWHS